jgi:hypothetical protein
MAQHFKLTPGLGITKQLPMFLRWMRQSQASSGAIGRLLVGGGGMVYQETGKGAALQGPNETKPQHRGTANLSWP